MTLTDPDRVGLRSGARLGVYEIAEQIGEGGMGQVYRATDTRLKRQVAIKILPLTLAAGPSTVPGTSPARPGDDRLARFRREAEVLASLNHPHIAAIYGLEESTAEVQPHILALVMELVEGPTLAERIASGPIRLDEALAIARQITEALEAAHEQGIVHRDLKPANIKVRPDGTVKVLDFGLAKGIEAVAAPAVGATMSPTVATMSPTATMAGMILGTAAYMSPEQASGKPVDKRADIWAFGVVLWEMLTGRQMFEGETVSHVLAGVLTRDPDLTVVPLRVRHLLARCLEREPKKRLRDIGDAMSLVQDPALRANDAPSVRRWPLVAAWTTAAALLVALGVAMWSRPAVNADTAAGLPAIKFQVERPSVDPYNNGVLAFAVSPDGKWLAHYTKGTSGRVTLSIRTLATGEAREVPGSAVQSPVAPFWSADSRQVVYATTVVANVFDLSTGAVRELCRCRFRGGSWSRDGVILLGSSGRGNRESMIQRLSLEDRTLVPVTKIDNAKGEQDAWPVFLADGSQFLFTRTAPDAGTATYLGSLDGDDPERITTGSRSLFTTLNGLGPHVLGVEVAGVVAQPFDVKRMTVSGDPVIIAAGAAAASVSANGVLATSVAGSLPSTVPTWFDRKGAALGSFGAPGRIQSVNLTSDGRTLAVNEGRANDPFGIWLRNSAGADRRLASNADGVDNAPAWSLDGARMIVSSRRGNVVNLYERKTDGSGLETRLVTSDRDTYVNDWSRDGRSLIYTMPKAGAAGRLDLDLWVIPLDGHADHTPVPYLATPAREAQAEFSPDGRFVAYTSIQGGDPEVYVQPFPNASEGKWLISNGSGSEPHWSRDGKELFYFAGQTLMAVPVSLQPTFSSGSPVSLFDAPVQPWFVNDSDRSQVASDGRFLLLVPSGKSTTPPIDIVVNWPTLLKK